MGIPTSLDRRQFAKTSGGVVVGALLAGCSAGGGCGTPDADAEPRSLLPTEGGGYERVGVSSESLQAEGQARVRGTYSDSYSRYSAAIFRFASEQKATEYEDYLLRAAEVKNESAYVVLTRGNFTVIGLSDGGASPDETMTHVKELLARSPTLTVGCISEHNALTEDLLPGSSP